VCGWEVCVIVSGSWCKLVCMGMIFFIYKVYLFHLRTTAWTIKQEILILILKQQSVYDVPLVDTTDFLLFLSFD
jgi:hypothetical protein